MTAVSEPPPSPPPPSRIYTIGRLAFWLVLALMLLSVGYAAWQAVANWSAITV
jgi:hypothetical protein